MKTDVDDSILIHYASGYDPAKARAYYLRTRKLKGRPKGSGDSSLVRGPNNPQTKLVTQRRSSSGDSSIMRPSRQKELQAQRDALEKRLDRLREVLAQLVDAAKKRSGVKEPSTDTKSVTETKSSTSSKKDSKPDKPLTESQKREKREASKKQYEVEKKTSISQEVEQLQAKVRDIQSLIKKAAADAQKSSSLIQPKTASNGR